MSVEIKIPHVGESIAEVQISEWLKTEGDTVKRDEVVAVIDSEKTTFELTAPEGGRLAKIFHQAGETVKVGEAVAQIEPTETVDPSPTPKAQPTAKTGPATEPKPEVKTPPPTDKIKSTEEKPVEPEVPTSGPETTQSSEQVVEPALTTLEGKSKGPAEIKSQAPAAKPAADREEKVTPMTMLRRTAARRLVEAKQQMAMLTTFNEVDMSAVQSLRKTHQEAFEKRYQARLGFMSFFVKATVDALKQFTQLNAEIRENNIVSRNFFDIGVAIASERGLIVPVLRNAEHMNFAEVETAIGDFGRRAKEGKLNPADLAGGTFTITNGGVFGSLLSTPIINPPQSGILGMHTIQERPVAVKGEVVIRPMMYVALTYDHRLVDGREAVLFLHRVKETIENPARLLIGV